MSGWLIQGAILSSEADTQLEEIQGTCLDARHLVD